MTGPIPLNFEIILMLSILGIIVVLSLLSMVRVDVIAILVLMLLGITKLLTPDQLFSGFSSDAVISLIAVMIIGGGLEKSGIALKAARWILSFAHEKPEKVNTVLMIASGLLSGFMRSLGTVALLLPVVTRINTRTGIPKSRLLIPMAFCATLGGSLTMVGTSPLILLNSLLKNADSYVTKAITFAPFHLFSVFPVGLALLIVGILYFIICGKRILPNEPIQFHFSGATKTHFLKTYGKGGDIFEVRMQEESPLANLTVSEFEAALDATCSVLAVLHENELYFPPLRNLKITTSSLVAIMGTKVKVQEFAEKYKLKLHHRLTGFAEILHPVRAGLCEAVIPPSSQLVGQELRELHMKRNYQIHVLALLRGQTLYQKEALMDLVLRPGDTLGMFCRWEALADFHKNPDFVVLTTDYPIEELRPKKMWFAIFFFLLSLGLIVFGNFSVSVGLFLGAVGMVATGVLSMDEAYETVSWRTIFLIAGLIPLGLAMQATHTTDWLTQYMVLLKDLPLWIVMAFLALFASLLSFFISGVGSTVVLVPMAIELATALQVDPRQMALVVAVAASNIFSAPSYQANALIAGPGNYQTKDFLRAGIGMMLLYWITMLIVIYWLF